MKSLYVAQPSENFIRPTTSVERFFLWHNTSVIKRLIRGMKGEQSPFLQDYLEINNSKTAATRNKHG